MTFLRVSGVDPGKHHLHCAKVEWDLPAPYTSAGWKAAKRTPLSITFTSIEWVTARGWQEGVDLFTWGLVATEGQWIDKHVFDRWQGIESVIHTRGAMQGMAAGLGYREHVLHGPPEQSLFAHCEQPCPRFVVSEPTGWRTVSLAPRPFNVRTAARATEQALARAFLVHLGMPTLVKNMSADHAAALGIALARVGYNYHMWLPL